MHPAVYRMLTLLCTLVVGYPVGTNLGLLHLLWMLVSGRLLESRGAVIPGLDQLGLCAGAVRRAWAALGGGDWESREWLERWQGVVLQEGKWEAHTHHGYHPLAADLVGFRRPRLRDCPTKHYEGVAGKAVPAIPVGIVARVGSVGAARLALPLALVRPDCSDPSPSAHNRALVREAVGVMAPQDALVVDAGFGVALLHEEGVERYVARVPKNFTARRATPPQYCGVGRRPTRGTLVRPLPRTHKGRLIAATPADSTYTWSEDGVEVHAQVWEELVLPADKQEAPSFSVVAIHDPRHTQPLLLASPLPIPSQGVRDLYRDRWPIEQLPLAAKQMLGAHRQFVHASETRLRLPELALIAGSVLSYVAATSPAIPTGYWDRKPEPTPGRLRRLLASTPFPQDFPLPERIRLKRSCTDHLPKGFWGQRRRTTAATATPTPEPHPQTLHSAA